MDSSIQIPLVLFFFVVIFVTGVPSNILAFYTFLVKVRQKPTPVGILLLNLTVSDLLLLCLLPFKMVETASDMHWPMPFILCPIVAMACFCSIYVSILFLTAVSVERYLGVTFPIKFKVNRNTSYTVVASCLIWICTVFQGSILFFDLQFLPSNETSEDTCNKNYSDEQLYIILPYRLECFIVLFCVPFLITTFCYVNFVRVLMSMPNIGSRKKYRAIGLAVATLCNFVICFAPFNSSHVIGFIQRQSPDWKIYTLVLSSLNASLDPIVFYYSSNAVQRAFANCARGFKNKLNALCSSCANAKCSAHDQYVIGV